MVIFVGGCLCEISINCVLFMFYLQAFYRQYVLSKIPQLKSFDFSTVTKADRVTAEMWSRSFNAQKKKSKNEEDQ